jgi:hypothetical protein
LLQTPETLLCFFFHFNLHLRRKNLIFIFVLCFFFSTHFISRTLFFFLFFFGGSENKGTPKE